MDCSRASCPRQPTQAAAFTWKPTGSAPPPDLFTLMRDRLPWPRVIAVGAGLLALLVAAAEAGNWGTFLQFLYHVPYGADDPLYNKDIGFYLFSLPAYILIKNWILLTLVSSALLAGTIYWVHGDIEYDVHHRSMSPTAIAHGSALLGLLFAVKAWSYGLDRYLLLYGDNGVVVGASYTDVHVGLPVLWLLIGLSIIAAFAAATSGCALPASCRRDHARRHRLFRAVRCSPCAVPAVFRQTKRAAIGGPYIERNIALTRQAYNLDQIAAKPFAAEQKLTFKALDANKATIDNIRLWDWLPLSDTYAQLRRFAPTTNSMILTLIATGSMVPTKA